MGIKKDIVWRLAVIYVFALVVALAIVIKVFYIQFTMESELKDADYAITQKDMIIEPIRGDICSDDNRILATSLPMYEVRMDLKSDGLTDELFTKNLDSLALCLSQLFKDSIGGQVKTKAQYINELVHAREAKKRYHLIRKKVNYGQLMKLKKFPLFRLSKYKSGLMIIEQNNREKPYSQPSQKDCNSKDNQSLGISNIRSDCHNVKVEFFRFQPLISG